MKESGQPITIDNTAGVIAFTPALPAAAPAAHSDSVHSGAVANLLTALTPTFANWTQNPGTNANLVDNLSSAVLTTSGIGAAGNNTIKYNLGSSRFRMFYLTTDQVFTVDISDDDNAYWTVIGNGVASLIGQTAIGKFQYVRLTLAGIKTTAYLKMRCHNIN